MRTCNNHSDNNGRFNVRKRSSRTLFRPVPDSAAQGSPRMLAPIAKELLRRTDPEMWPPDMKSGAFKPFYDAYIAARAAGAVVHHPPFPFLYGPTRVLRGAQY
eukprot:3384208-Rhodomonas_salina.1